MVVVIHVNVKIILQTFLTVQQGKLSCDYTSDCKDTVSNFYNCTASKVNYHVIIHVNVKILLPTSITVQQGKLSCDYTCECKDTVTNFYNCTARCKAYPNLPSICILKPDPTDPCCKVPDCGPYTAITGNKFTGTIPSNKFNLVPIGTHSFFYGSSQNPNALQGTSSKDACIYKNKVHKQGASWDYGCDYVCTCLYGLKGLYGCLSKCPSYPALPSYCKKNRVPGQCCPVISCDIPGYGSFDPDSQLVPTPLPTKIGELITPALTSLVPIIQIDPNPSQNITSGIPGGGYPIKPDQITGISNQCVYKNKVYNKGESWDIDCDFTCTCVDGSTGYYECKPRCPTFNILPRHCFTTTVQGQCCKAIKCVSKDGSIGKPYAQFPVVGSYTGGFLGFRPGVSYKPGINTTSVNGLGCIYKGQLHQAGDEWDDGCDFHCKCVDSKIGRYQCTAQCPEFTKLPALCEFITVSGQCCKRLQCRTPTTVAPGIVTPTPIIPTPDPHPGCTDVIDNCADYGQSVCQQPYDAWARRNCQHYCGKCAQPGMTTPTPLCQDKLPNCDLYGPKVCVNEYVPWAKENCQHYCGMCADQMTTSTPSCVDKNPSACADIGPDVCTLLIDFARENCAHQCNLCPEPSVPSVQVTKAHALTPNFPGHHKPILSNNWTVLCLDKVRVSIYKKGVEKAFMLFNATGADKMSWFTPSRIIDSSWVDLQSTTKQYFAMSQDPDFSENFMPVRMLDNSKCDSNWLDVYIYSKQVLYGSRKETSFLLCSRTDLSSLGISQPGMTTPTPLCQDKLPNCDLYGQESSACADIGPDVCTLLIDFARENCAHQCNLCPEPSVPSVQVTKYIIITLYNLCPKPSVTSVQVTSASTNGYVLLMKGVTGVGTYPPGITDLFELWNSTKTINEFQPEAHALTPNFPGHYKPILSNNWTVLCLDKVRVSIYKKGVEKAFMLFNATGADKMSWFTPSRIIDSSWVDLQSTTKQYFAMSQDPDFLREFYASQNADNSKCDSTGWMFISTANRCYMEAEKKPAFYYAPGQTSAHWGYSAGCLYKGSLYHQGDSWEVGCVYTCTCDDEHSGHFSCHDLCPVYDHLPNICKVVIPNGQCCGHVECRPVRILPTDKCDSCFYKGQCYGWDETFIDDCKYKCECLSGNQGFYKCKELCYKWDLPSSCTLNEPAPGKCCKRPSCPPWISIQYPEGYKEE
ncbi:unnamed protein product [Mytilus coruscus]|uniref:VWFC domain-containing protein n=1 Tax=Mytilus coruscus TaxID=42192 RepID=A0A6J8BGE7_MYTCO|nr:unnamed protein product [Mytilus coruscus]